MCVSSLLAQEHTDSKVCCCIHPANVLPQHLCDCRVVYDLRRYWSALAKATCCRPLLIAVGFDMYESACDAGHTWSPFCVPVYLLHKLTNSSPTGL